MTVSGVLCVVGTLVGTGVLGTRVQESSGGALAADATLLAPAGPAFSIWSVVYLGLLGYVVWQWLPAHTTDERARQTGWWAGASMLLNAAWLLVTQQGWLWVSVGVIVALAVVLKVVISRLTRLPARGVVDRVLLDGTFGLYLGWVAVATCANVAATLVASGVSAEGTGAEVVTLVALAVVLGLAAWYATRFGGRVAVALAMAWGLGWVAYGRLVDGPESTLVGVSAAVVAAAVLATLLLPRADPPERTLGRAAPQTPRAA